MVLLKNKKTKLVDYLFPYNNSTLFYFIEFKTLMTYIYIFLPMSSNLIYFFIGSN